MFSDLEALFDRAKPDAVAAFTNTFDHLAVIEAAASRGVHVMVEKPLAVSMAHARAIEQAAGRGRIARHRELRDDLVSEPPDDLAGDARTAAGGAIRKMVAMDGHPGPKEIGVQPEFLDWLGDPARNGAGALFDFGCYGANLMTWLMDDERPAVGHGGHAAFQAGDLSARGR